MTVESSHQNFLKYFRYGNHTSIKLSLDKVIKTLNKENRNQYLLPFPNWLARFIPNLHLTPQGLLSKPNKNDILIWDGSFRPDWESICVNMMLDRTTEPKVVYVDAFMRHLIQIWNQHITHPNEEIYVFDDDTKGAFRHPKYHPDVATAFAFRIEQYLMVPLGNTFGSVVSPQD